MTIKNEKKKESRDLIHIEIAGQNGKHTHKLSPQTKQKKKRTDARALKFARAAPFPNNQELKFGKHNCPNNFNKYAAVAEEKKQ